MPRTPRRRRDHLRLVETRSRALPPVLTSRAARAEFERLTQDLLDVAIEIMDLADGDADLEPDLDEGEDETSLF